MAEVGQSARSREAGDGGGLAAPALSPLLGENLEAAWASWSSTNRGRDPRSHQPSCWPIALSGARTRAIGSLPRPLCRVLVTFCPLTMGICSAVSSGKRFPVNDKHAFLLFLELLMSQCLKVVGRQYPAGLDSRAHSATCEPPSEARRAGPAPVLGSPPGSSFGRACRVLVQKLPVHDESLLGRCADLWTRDTAVANVFFNLGNLSCPPTLAHCR